MITKVTSENKGLYKALFEKASNILGLEGDQTIDSLDKYFSVIKTLVEDEDGGVTYGFLPLDEPTFDINADTRVITVPSDFKKHGISVKGDHYAETLYFTINRYFDTTDLYDDHIKIIIQWEDPDGNKGVSLAVFKDVTVLASENKMLFGWALTDNITKSSGNVKFAVRFYEVDGNQALSYSLSTLTASAIINPGLDYQFENGAIVDDIPLFADDAQNLRNRLRNSIYVDPTDIPEEATWVINLPAPSGEVLQKIDLNENSEYSFIVEAESEQGVITYSWKWIPTGSADAVEPIGTVGDVYVITDDTAYSGTKVYYKLVSVDNVDAYETFEFVPDASVSEAGFDVYEKKSGLTISHHGDPETLIVDGQRDPNNHSSITGKYYVIANNRIGLGTSMVESNHVIVPGPADLESISPAEEVTAAILDGATTGSVTLTASANTAQTGDTITYSWGEIYVEDDVEHFLPDAEGTSTVAKGTTVSRAIEDIAAANRPTFDKTYAVKIKANRNGDSTDVITRKYRVTDAAHTPIVTLSKVGTYVNTESSAILTATVSNADEIAHDAFSYQWFLYNSEDNADPNEFEIAGDTALSVDPVVSTAASNTYQATAGGSYYCVVRTIVNGTTSTAWVPTQEDQLLGLYNRS